MSSQAPDPRAGVISGPALETGRDSTVDAAGPLDLLLADAALGPARRFVPGMAMARFATRLAAQPALLTSRLAGLGTELGRIAAGRSELAAPPRIPAMVEPGAFTVGVDLAVTPGSVVLECGHHPDARGRAPGLHRARAGQQPHRAGPGQHAGPAS
ncbi:MAG: hypothetical protein ACLPKI_09505 [Streptosporangiaceae bacterium]